MSLNNIKNQGASIGTSVFPKSQKTTKRVEDIILNENHPAYTGPDSIGIIFFADEKTKEDTLDPTSLPRAKPLNLNNYTTPLIGELVHIQSSINENYYPEIGGNPNFTSNYYTNTINVYNNAGSNAVPLNKRTKRRKKKDKTRESEPNFEFTKEFRTKGSQQVVVNNCNNYLRDLGYSSGRSDPNAPKYILSQAFNGDYILRLDDSKENKVKLGLYYREKKNQQNLNPSEGSTLFQGKDGQRIHYLSTGPNGVNSVSRNVTDIEDDGNPNIGDSAMILSLGKGSTENITDDAASIYLGENLNLPNLLTVLASTNIDSTKSKYEKLKDPLEAIAEQANIVDLSTVDPPDTPETTSDLTDGFDDLNEVIEEEGIIDNAEEYEYDAEETDAVAATFNAPIIEASEGEDFAEIINPTKIGRWHPGIGGRKRRNNVWKEYPPPSNSSQYCPVYKEFKFTLRHFDVTHQNVLDLANKGELVMVGDANTSSKFAKGSANLRSVKILDNKYYLHKACAGSFLNWLQEMDQNNIKYLVSSALRFGKNTGGGPHGMGIAVDFSNLYQELVNYGPKFKGGQKTAVPNQSLRKDSQIYKDIAGTGAKWGWYNPWRLSDVVNMEEVWHFEYWGEPFALGAGLGTGGPGLSGDSAYSPEEIFNNPEIIKEYSLSFGSSYAPDTGAGGTW